MKFTLNLCKDADCNNKLSCARHIIHGYAGVHGPVIQHQVNAYGNHYCTWYLTHAQYQKNKKGKR